MDENNESKVRAVFKNIASSLGNKNNSTKTHIFNLKGKGSLKKKNKAIEKAMKIK